MAKLKTPQTSPKTPKTKNGAADMDESNESIFASPVSFERVQEASARLREVLNPSNGEGDQIFMILFYEISLIGLNYQDVTLKTTHRVG